MARKSNAVRKPAEPKVTAETAFPSNETLDKQGFGTKSAKIRELARLGMAKGDIARQVTGGLYQHVYNVLKRPLKRPEAPAASNETPEAETEANA